MRPTLAWLLGLLVAGPVAAEPVDYLRDIKPLLRARCYSCHGALWQKSGLRLDTATLIRQGGNKGPALTPGNSADSLLLDAVAGSNGLRRMPPKGEGEPLSEKQIALLRVWIDQGAKAPNEPIPENPRHHWAFRVPTRPTVPRVPNATWVCNPIDAFVAVEHAQRGLQPNPPAAKADLLRRVYLDLIGLPPTREELHTFLADPSDQAYEQVVERLLASPQYGERWARHWMDVWRYSDWYGRRAVPDVWNSAPQIWRWRDWIVRSLNADKGYDQMVREMLAADEIAPEDDETIVATGYLVRNWYALNPNQWMRDIVEHTGKAFLGLTLNCAHCHDHKYDPITHEEYFRFRAFFEPLELRQDWVPGEPDPGPFQKYEYAVLRRVVQAGSIRVFDEKLDAKTYVYLLGDERNRAEGKPPVAPAAPAFLEGDRLRIRPVELPPVASYPGLKPFVQQVEVGRWEKAIAKTRMSLDKARRELIPVKQALAEIEAETDPARPTPPVVADARARRLVAVRGAEVAVQLGEAQLAAAEAELVSTRARLAADNVKYKGMPGKAEELARAASKADRVAVLCAAQEKQLQAEQSLDSARQKADAAAVRKAEERLTAAAKAVALAHKALATESTQYRPLSPVYPSQSTGRRRALAEWIGSRDNPLTARVAVNHIWMRHFGRALVESVFDFGRNGKKPTHPELLDWLAVEFMESGWSMKHLHRLIVTSNTYRMQSASKNNPALALDADNRWLWRFPARRMEAEVVRDSILQVVGELDPRLGGPPLENKLEAASRRRSLYFSVYPEDGGHPKFLELFDAPDPCDCYRRSESIVPQQALVLTNSRLLLDQSRLLARKLWSPIAETPAAAQTRQKAFVVAAFEQVLSRRPSSQELALCQEFLGKQGELLRTTRPQSLKSDAASTAPSPDPAMRARESLVRALFSHDDFITMR